MTQEEIERFDKYHKLLAEKVRLQEILEKLQASEVDSVELDFESLPNGKWIEERVTDFLINIFESEIEKRKKEIEEL